MNVKNTVCVVGQFGGYFIVNTLIMYLIIPPSTTFSHALDRLELEINASGLPMSVKKFSERLGFVE